MILTCKFPELETLRCILFDYVHDQMGQAAMGQAADGTEWARTVSTAIDNGGCMHLGWWEGCYAMAGTENKWPWLAMSCWLLPTNHENLMNERNELGRPTHLERAQHLGYRGVIPTCISNILLSGKSVPRRFEKMPDPRGINDSDFPLYKIANAINTAAAHIRRKHADNL